MKITREDYTRLERHIKTTLQDSPKCIDNMAKLGYSNERIRWTIFHYTTDRLLYSSYDEYSWVVGLGNYLNGDNINTALKSIIDLT